MADLLNLGLSGLHAAKTNLSVVGHNIANVNTPGYSRQEAIQNTRPAQFTGGGYLGNGASITDVRRIYSEFLTAQLRTSTAHNSDIQAYKSQIDQLDSLLASTTTGITPAMQSFFSAMQTAAEDPANMPARQLVLAESQGLAKRFNNVYENIHTQNEFINKQLVTVSEQVNRLAAGIAQMNDAISRSGSSVHQPNDLLDQREEAIRELSTLIGVEVVRQDDNTLNLFVGSGQPLVLGSNANSIEVTPGRGNPNQYDVNFVSGHSKMNINTMVTGGEMGGLLRYRNEVLDPTLNSMGRLAMAVGDEINRQLGQGLDLKGNVGVDLFSDINDPKLQALRVLPMADNSAPVTGGNIEITNTQLLTISDYRMDFDGTNYQVTRLSDGAIMVPTPAIAPGVAVSFADSEGRDQGFSLTLDPSTNHQVGDQILLQPTRRGAEGITSVLDQADQLAFAAPIRSEADLQNKGTGTIGQPSLEAVDGGANELNLDLLSKLSGVQLEYAIVSNDEGRLDLQGSLPAGYTATFSPASLTGIKPGNNNELSYDITISDGTNSQTYSIKQSFSGRPEAGDTFSTSFNQHGVSDNRNALKLVDLQNKQVVGLDANVTDIETGMSFTDDYAKSVENVGTLAAQARRDDDASSAVLKMAQDNRDSLSGVNLDEEAAKLIQYEHYYNAAAQMIQVARTLFDTLISSVR